MTEPNSEQGEGVEDLGELFKEIHRANGMTTRRIQEVLGISRSTWSAIARGKRKASPRVLQALLVAAEQGKLSLQPEERARLRQELARANAHGQDQKRAPADAAAEPPRKPGHGSAREFVVWVKNHPLNVLNVRISLAPGTQLTVASITTAVALVGLGFRFLPLGEEGQLAASPKQHGAASSSTSPTLSTPTTAQPTPSAERSSAPPKASAPRRSQPQAASPAPSQPSPAQAVPPTVPSEPTPGQLTTGCHWRVVGAPSGHTIGVFERPTKNSRRVNGKPNGKIVGDYCDTVRNDAEEITFVAVKTASAADGVAWMNGKSLTRTTQTG